ncbi:MAG: alpha/beta-type small acid-soluble spore protein, partial [Clostridia bacterium]|nr:alpha/beta-type small acid-soluble spore protein [Clostridia bacterium]
MRRRNPKSAERRTDSRRKAKVFDGTGTSREVGVNLQNGYNGDLTARQAGSIGGQMVKKMIESYENNLSA